MTCAYNEIYLDDAMKNLGEAFDYAANACKMPLESFAQLFVSTGFSDRYGRGTPKLLSGMSGTEMTMDILTKSGLCIEFPSAQVLYDCSPEYWCGWILAYYQWISKKRFKDILEILPISEILKLYNTLHEASEDKFAEVADAIINSRRSGTKLKRQRNICKYSQSELAKRSGVNLRTLQQYELGTKDIRKAAVDTVLSLSAALGCKMEEILD